MIDQLEARKYRAELFIAPVAVELGGGKTGTWRTKRPLWKAELCKPCNICSKYCPEGIISVTNKKVQIDYDYCKGCGICVNECPRGAIEIVPEI